MVKTLTLASIYELQGLKEDALDIYKDILKNDPKNKEVDEQMKKFFVNMKKDVEFLEFERWLVKL